MSTTNYPEAVSTGTALASKRRWGGDRLRRKWLGVPVSGWLGIAVGALAAQVMLAVHATGSVVLIVAAWVALVTAGVVSYRRFVKREQRRREASGI